MSRDKGIKKKCIVMSLYIRRLTANKCIMKTIDFLLFQYVFYSHAKCFQQGKKILKYYVCSLYF